MCVWVCLSVCVSQKAVDRLPNKDFPSSDEYRYWHILLWWYLLKLHHACWIVGSVESSAHPYCPQYRWCESNRSLHTCTCGCNCSWLSDDRIILHSALKCLTATCKRSRHISFASTVYIAGFVIWSCNRCIITHASSVIYDRGGFHFLFYLHGMTSMKARSSFILNVINYLQCNMKSFTGLFLLWCGLPVSIVSSSFSAGTKRIVWQRQSRGSGEKIKISGIRLMQQYGSAFYHREWIISLSIKQQICVHIGVKQWQRSL